MNVLLIRTRNGIIIKQFIYRLIYYTFIHGLSLKFSSQESIYPRLTSWWTNLAYSFQMCTLHHWTSQMLYVLLEFVNYRFMFCSGTRLLQRFSLGPKCTLPLSPEFASLIPQTVGTWITQFHAYIRIKEGGTYSNHITPTLVLLLHLFSLFKLPWYGFYYTHRHTNIAHYDRLLLI